MMIELSEAEAEALLEYTKSSLCRDDNYDDFRELIESAVDELEKSINSGE